MQAVAQESQNQSKVPKVYLFPKSPQSLPDRDSLILDNQRLVYKIAHKIHRSYPHLDFDDLNSAGTVGLIRAADRFDPDSGYAFSTFAYQKIRGAILHEIRDKWQPIKISRSHYELRNKLTKLEQQELSDQAIALELKVSDQELINLRDSLNVLKTRAVPVLPGNQEEIWASAQGASHDSGDELSKLSQFVPRVIETFEIVCTLGRTTTTAIALKMGITQGRVRDYLGRLRRSQLIIKTGFFYQANFEQVVIEGIKRKVQQKIEITNFLAKLQEVVEIKAKLKKLETELKEQGGDRAQWILDNLATVKS